jgi:hypothetical protein
MGIMILVAALVIGALLATGVVPDYWTHSIANELNTAQPGSVLLSQLATMSSYAKWLYPLRMVGMAFLFSGITLALTVIITLALTVIIGTLRLQSKMLTRFLVQVES